MTCQVMEFCLTGKVGVRGSPASTVREHRGRQEQQNEAAQEKRGLGMDDFGSYRQAAAELGLEPADLRGMPNLYRGEWGREIYNFMGKRPPAGSKAEGPGSTLF